MRILFVSIWPADSGIFTSTIPPTIEYWLKESIVEHVTLLSFDESPTKIQIDGSFDHISIVEDKSRNHLIRLIKNVSSTLKQTKSKKFDLIWARGVTSGNVIYLASILSGIPFGVESFEPHTKYMLEGNVWGKYSGKSILQKWLENQMIKHSKVLITVSQHYTRFLLEKYPSLIGRVFTMPCAIDFSKFAFHEDTRTKMRLELGFTEENRVGIYVGKFGDIYYDDDFFRFLKLNQLASNKNRVLILTPTPDHAIQQIEKFGLDRSKIHVKSVEHNEVPSYLSASDYAFCPVVKSPSRKYCSPIKTGEYMANGLPILISEGIGEDSEFIEQNGLGIVVDFEIGYFNLSECLSLVRMKTDSVFNWRDQTFVFTKYTTVFNAD